MKATVKDGIKGFSGKLDGAIYYYHPRLKRTLMRKIPKMPVQAQNLKMRDISRQIKSLEPSEAYRSDFRYYLSLMRDYHPEIAYPSWYSLFVKMLWAMQRKYPDQVDLLTLTKAQITAQNLPCKTLKAAIADGLLQEVPGWQHLDEEF